MEDGSAGAHGGTASIESSGGGTLVRLSLPEAGADGEATGHDEAAG